MGDTLYLICYSMFHILLGSIISKITILQAYQAFTNYELSVRHRCNDLGEYGINYGYLNKV